MLEKNKSQMEFTMTFKKMTLVFLFLASLLLASCNETVCTRYEYVNGERNCLDTGHYDFWGVFHD